MSAALHARASGILLLAGLAASLGFDGRRLWPFTLALGFLLAALAWSAAARPPRLVRPSPLASALLALWAWLALGVLWSRVPYVSAIQAWWQGAAAVSFLALVLSPQPAATWRTVGGGAAALAVALALWGLGQWLLADEQPHGPFANPNSHAAFLNVAALGLLGTCLAAAPRGRAWHAALGTFGLLVLGMAAVGSRGALLAFAGGLALVLGAAANAGRRRDALAAAAVAAAAVAAASLLTHGRPVTRIATLGDPLSAGADRLVIWRGALELLAGAPWHGEGPGTFWLLYPAVREPEDTSGGYHAHNDYLELAIEAGVPAVVLVAAVGLAAVLAWRRVWTRGPRHTLEGAGLLAAVAATAAHSLVTFNLYVLPILVACGACLGRLELLSRERCERRAQAGGRGPAKRQALLAGLVWLVPAAWLGSLALGEHALTEGRALAARGELRAALEALARAERLAPGLDAPAANRAELLIHLLGRLRERNAPPPELETVHRAALDALARARARNPLRADLPYLRARLAAVGALPEGPGWRDTARRALREALRLDPLHVEAREALARLLLEEGRRGRARALLREGLERWHPPSTRYLRFLRAAARTLEALGDAAGARLARQRAAETARALAAMRAGRDVLRAPGSAAAP